MAKIQIKSERLTPFEGLFSIMEQFDSAQVAVGGGIQVICIISFGRIQKKITFAMENQERYDL